MEPFKATPMSIASFRRKDGDHFTPGLKITTEVQEPQMVDVQELYDTMTTNQALYLGETVGYIANVKFKPTKEETVIVVVFEVCPAVPKDAQAAFSAFRDGQLVRVTEAQARMDLSSEAAGKALGDQLTDQLNKSLANDGYDVRATVTTARPPSGTIVSTVGEPITREEALETSQRIMEEAEAAREPDAWATAQKMGEFTAGDDVVILKTGELGVISYFDRENNKVMVVDEGGIGTAKPFDPDALELRATTEATADAS